MTDTHTAVSERTVICKETTITLRRLAEADQKRMLDFGAALPLDDVIYLEEDYHSPEIITRLVNASHAENWRQVVAIAGDEIIGYSAVRRLPGWSRHVGDMRLLIRPDWRRCGLGTALGQSIFDQANELGVDKVIIEMLETQNSGRAIFERLGFQIEGNLTDHVIDRQGQRQHLIILAYHLR